MLLLWFDYVVYERQRGWEILLFLSPVGAINRENAGKWLKDDEFWTIVENTTCGVLCLLARPYLKK